MRMRMGDWERFLRHLFFLVPCLSPPEVFLLREAAEGCVGGGGESSGVLPDRRSQGTMFFRKQNPVIGLPSQGSPERLGGDKDFRARDSSVQLSAEISLRLAAGGGIIWRSKVGVEGGPSPDMWTLSGSGGFPSRLDRPGLLSKSGPCHRRALARDVYTLLQYSLNPNQLSFFISSHFT